MSGALAARTTDKEQEKGRVGQTKVKRYWPGKAPDWVDDEALEPVREVFRTEVAAPVIIKKTDDPRLRRLAASRGVDREEAIERHRQIRAAEVVKRERRHDDDEEEDATDDVGTDVVQKHKEDEVDEDEVQRRRQAVRERLLAQQKAQEQAAAAAPAEEEEEEEEEEESSEYETDSEDEAQAHRLVKPVFVPKDDRDTIAERERLAKEEEDMAERERRRKDERKGETRQLVYEVVAQEAAAKAAAANGSAATAVEDVDTSDENEEAEYEAWKVREMTRIRRERELREAAVKEAELKEKLRNMTEEERAQWERDNPKEGGDKQKKKWKFMQKYWHVGAYYQTSADDVRGTGGGDSIYARDYSAPTGEDKMDREKLRSIQQVKNFGRSGRSKWTHLVAEDTSRQREDVFNAADEVRAKLLQEKLAGAAFNKPKTFKR